MKKRQVRNKAQRWAFIQRELTRQQFVKIETICQQFNVSDQTARTDLKELESQGLCKKTHGGAVVLGLSSTDGESETTKRPGFGIKDTQIAFGTTKKQDGVTGSNMASHFEEVFEDVTSLFLPADPQLMALFDQLYGLFPSDSMIYTNSVIFATRHAQAQGAKLVLLPGELSPDGSATGGRLLEDYLLRLPVFSMAIFRINRISPQQMRVGFDSGFYGRIAEEMLRRKKFLQLALMATGDVSNHKRSFHYLNIRPNTVSTLILEDSPENTAQLDHTPIAAKTIKIAAAANRDNCAGATPYIAT